MNLKTIIAKALRIGKAKPIAPPLLEEGTIMLCRVSNGWTIHSIITNNKYVCTNPNQVVQRIAELIRK